MDIDYVNGDLGEALQDWINKKKRKGQPPSQTEINQHMAELLQAYSAKPNPDYNGFTPDQMDDMEFSAFEEGCPVQIRDQTDEEIEQIPLMRQILHLMNALAEKDIKLTVTGALPMKMVKELYELGVHSWGSDYYLDRLTEQKCEEVMIVRRVLEGAVLIKKRLGKLSLTAKGKKYIKNRSELFKFIINYLFIVYNTGWLDLYPDEFSGNEGRLYSLWLLHHYGSQWENINLYTSRYYRAMDFTSQSPVYILRIYERLFHILGLCELKDIRNTRGTVIGKEVRKTPILELMFTFVEPAQV